MPGFKEYDIKIADYFDNKMSAAEEYSFMEELGVSTPLRERYEDELAIRAILGSGVENDDIAVEDNVVYMNTATTPAPHKTPIVPLYKRYNIVAAALVLGIGVSAVFMILKNKNNNTYTVATTVKNNTAPKADTPQNINLPNLGITSASAFAKYYTPYNSGSDPVEVSIYYQDYKQGHYADILAATDADLQVMGVNDNKEQLNQYLQLYKALAYLAENKPAKALQQFDAVTHSSNKTSTQYYEAQWYSCMALLKQGDVTKAALLAKAIAQTSSSPYKAKAGELAAGLGPK